VIGESWAPEDYRTFIRYRWPAREFPLVREAIRWAIRKARTRERVFSEDAS
jgi:hypothetical protein